MYKWWRYSPDCMNHTCEMTKHFCDIVIIDLFFAVLISNLFLCTNYSMTLHYQPLIMYNKLPRSVPLLFYRCVMTPLALRSAPDMSYTVAEWLIIFANESCTGFGGVVPSAMSTGKEDSASSQDDATDEIMDRLVKSVTQNPTERQSSPKTRKRSRLNRKSCE